MSAAALRTYGSTTRVCGREARYRRRASMPRGLVMTDAVNIDAFLAGEGFDRAPAARRARQVLEAAGLTHSGKQALVASKLPAARTALAATLLRVCGDACLAIDRTGAGKAREAVIVGGPSCEICAGSNNQRGLIEMMRMLLRRGVARIVIVGGTAHQWSELRGLGGAGLDVRYVDGTRASHSGRDALANMRWAQLIIIWGPTPLKHAVSDLYTSEPLPHLRVITVTRRGIEALCADVVRSFT